MTALIIKRILLIAAILAVTLYQVRINYRVNMLEAKTSIQIGMTEKQATDIMGRAPRVIGVGDNLNPRLTFSKAVRCPNDRVLLYSNMLPAYYLVVHVNPKGIIDAVLLMES